MLAVLLQFGPLAAVATECAEAPENGRPVRLLIVTGGHPFDSPEFYSAFDSMPNIIYDHLEVSDPQRIDIRGMKRHYDVVLFFDMEPGIMTPQWRALLNLGKGLVFLHHSLGSFPETPSYAEIVGGHGNFFQTRFPNVPNSSYFLNENQHFAIVDRTHPITCGMNDFDMVDEAYDNLHVDPAAHVLLKSDFPKLSPAVSWVWKYHNKRVFYLQPGHGSLWLPENHGPTPYQNASFLRLLNRGLLWASGRL